MLYNIVTTTWWLIGILSPRTYCCYQTIVSNWLILAWQHIKLCLKSSIVDLRSISHQVDIYTLTVFIRENRLFIPFNLECQGVTVSSTDNMKQVQYYDTLTNDIWSLGIILINLVSGRNPWKQANMHDAAFAAYVKQPRRFFRTILPGISKSWFASFVWIQLKESHYQNWEIWFLLVVCSLFLLPVPLLPRQQPLLKTTNQRPHHHPLKYSAANHLKAPCWLT